MSKHTQEPWRVQPLSMSLDIHIHTARGNSDPIIASVNGYGRDHAVAEANARRIVACVNACGPDGEITVLLKNAALELDTHAKIAHVNRGFTNTANVGSATATKIREALAKLKEPST